MFKKIKFFLNYLKWAFIILFLPAIFIFVLSINISNVKKNKNDYLLNEGNIENIGFTEKFHKGGSMRSFPTRTKVFYIKLKDDNSLYSFFYRDESNYKYLFSNLKTNDIVKIYNDGSDIHQNTIDIIQLEKEKKIIISKDVYNQRELIISVLMIVFLCSYFLIPLVIIFLSNNSLKRNRQNK